MREKILLELKKKNQKEKTMRDAAPIGAARCTKNYKNMVNEKLLEIAKQRAEVNYMPIAIEIAELVKKAYINGIADGIEIGPTVTAGDTFLERMQIEFTELRDRKKKLNDFIDSAKFKETSAYQQEMLLKQRDVMTEYQNILAKRIFDLMK